MTAAELVQVVEAAGGRFMVDGDRLGIVPKEAAAPVLEELRAHKEEIIDLIESPRELLPLLPRGVRLVSYLPKQTPVCVPPCSTVMNVELFVRSTLVQLDACLKGQARASGNWSREVLLERLAAVGVIAVIEHGRTKRLGA